MQNHSGLTQNELIEVVHIALKNALQIYIIYIINLVYWYYILYFISARETLESIFS